MSQLPSNLTPVREAHVFDEQRLIAYMQANVEGFRGPVEVLQFEGGQSNPTFHVADAGGRMYVLRKKPPGKLLPSAHQVDREYRVMDRAPERGGVAGGFLLGMGFASGWTPCIGVTLGAVLSSAVTSGTTGQGLVLMVAYCLGLGVPFIVLAFALESARPLVRVINSHRRAIDLASAGVLLIMGVLLLTNKLAILSTGITPLVPSWPMDTLLPQIEPPLTSKVSNTLNDPELLI